MYERTRIEAEVRARGGIDELTALRWCAAARAALQFEENDVVVCTGDLLGTDDTLVACVLKLILAGAPARPS